MKTKLWSDALMSRRIIDKSKFSWKEEDRFKLDYKMVFEDRKPLEEPEVPDVDQILEAKLNEWNKQLEKARKVAFEQGYKQGRSDGMSQAREELDQRLGSLGSQFQSAFEAWKSNVDLLKPGILQLVFDITEAILEMPVTNGTMRNKLEAELSELIQEVDKKSRPVLWVSADDYELAESLITEYGENTGVILRVGKNCKPGEYQLDTNREKIVRDFRQMLYDFKDSLILPKS